MQGKVRERQARNLLTWLKNLSGSMKGRNTRTRYEQRYTVIHPISLKRTQRWAGEGKRLILLFACEKYAEYALLFRGIRRNQRQPGEGVRDSQGHGAPPAAILQQGYCVEAHMALDAVAQL